MHPSGPPQGCFIPFWNVTLPYSKVLSNSLHPERPPQQIYMLKSGFVALVSLLQTSSQRKVFSVPRVVPAFHTKEKAVVRKGLAQGMLTYQNPLSRTCSLVCHILGENFQYIWRAHLLYIKAIQIFVSVTRGHITN